MTLAGARTVEAIVPWWSVTIAIRDAAGSKLQTAGLRVVATL
jgi:hypothetical protein